MEEIELHPQPARASGIYLHFQALPANVCEHRNCDGQRAPQSRQQMGPLARGPLPQVVSGRSHAGIASSAASRRSDSSFGREVQLASGDRLTTGLSATLTEPAVTSGLPVIGQT